MNKKTLWILLLLIILGGIYYFVLSPDKDNAEVVPENTVKQSNAVIEPANGNKEAVSQDNTKQEPEVTEETAEDQTVETKAEEKPAKTEASTTRPTKIQWKEITDKEVGLRFKLPYYFVMNGKTIKAYGRKNELLNIESRYKDTLNGNELSIKVYPPENAKAIYDFQVKQFKSKAGFFAQSRKEVKVKDQRALYGVSVRRFDGKGHKLNPPAKVVTVVWFDQPGGQTYEVVFRAVKGDDRSVSLFNNILYSIK